MKKLGVDQEKLAVWLVFAAGLLITGFTMPERKVIFLSLGMLLFAAIFLVLLCPSRDNEGELYRWMAHKGDSKAQCDLAFHFYYGYQKDGLNIEPDYKKAFEWFRKAAEQGNVEAQGFLAHCYASGEGIGQNYTEAAKWLEKSAEQGDKISQNILGIYYSKGQGVTQDYAEAAKWYCKAAEQGFAKAQYNLGNCYSTGEGVTQDHAEAVRWLRQAAEQGLADAQCNLGICYYDGKGVPKDYKEAVKWYQKAAEQGYAAAQHNLAGCYYDGLGVSQDYVEAYKWHSLVGFGNLIHYLGGIENAKKWCDALKNKMSGEQIAESQRRITAFRVK
jgi:TPR repeat protein